jgi:multidrug efflux pump subunit AcrB
VNDFSKIKVNDDTFLGDIAKLKEGHQLLANNAIVNGKDAIVFVIEKTPGGNISEITKRVESKIDELSVGLSGVEINKDIFRQATFVEDVSHGFM